MTESLIVTPKFKKWSFLQTDDSVVRQLQEELKVHYSIAKLLVLRGVESKEAADLFLNPSLDQLHDPFLMMDMDKAVERVHDAIQQQEKILIYGDYDVDGITAVSLIYTYFKSFYSKIGYYVPDRKKEGCGISFDGIDYAQKNGYSLIIALDCGIKDHKEIDYATEDNIDIILCDHHIPEKDLPKAVAILNPKRLDSEYPFKDLSGCGVGFKLVQAYSMKYNVKQEMVFDLLDFVTLSIAADTVPVVGENRVLAYFGMKLMNNRKRPSFKAILDIIKVRRRLELMDLVYTISPRINAAGRILHASYAVELLIETDHHKAKSKAKFLHANNFERQQIDKSITSSALEIIGKDKDFDDKRAITIYQPDWHQGIIAIVASRMVEAFYKPTIILADSNEGVVGSGRSVRGFDLYKVIESCSEYLIQYGGHKYAAGFTMHKENVEDFLAAFHEKVEELIQEDQLTPKIDVDDVIELSDINEDFYYWITKMEPFGSGNQKPVFVTKDVKDTGNNGFVGKSHLKIHVTKPGQKAKYGIGFQMWDYIPYLRSQETFDICYHIYENKWNGERNIEIKLKDLK